MRKFEQDMRERADDEMRQQMAARRKAEELAGEAKRLRETAQRNEERIRANARAASMALSNESQGSATAMDTTPEWGTSQEPEDPLESFRASAAAADRLSTSFVSISEEDEMYPSPMRSTAVPTYDPPLPIEPGLTTPGYGSYGSPRLNWAFIFKNRRRLEENWRDNNFLKFQIPHPSYVHEGHRECIYTLQYSPTWLVSGSRDRTIRVWNIKTRRLRNGGAKSPGVLVGHTGSVLCLQFDESPEEDVLISGSSDSNVIIWKFSTGEILKVIENAHTESVLNLRFNKKWLITCSKDKLIKIWNRHTLETSNADYPWNSKTIFGSQGAPLNHPHHPNYTPNWTVQHPASTSGLGLHNPFGASGFKAPYGPMGQPAIKAIAPYSPCQALEGHAAAVNAIQLHGNEIVSASGDRTIKLWSLKTAMCEKTFLGHRKGIACIQYDGHSIVTGSSDQTIRVFDKNMQAEVATLRGHEALVRTVQASRDKIISGSYDESVRIWRRDPDTGGWTNGPVLRQNDVTIPTPQQPPPQTHAALQMQAMQQFQSNHSPAPTPGIQYVQNHVVHPVGSALAGAVAAAQLLPPANQQHLAPQASPASPAPPASPASPASPAPQAQPQPQQPVQAAPALQVPTAHGMHRVFKLQFDARWIICSQDSRIVGWDYAADDQSIVEASRFFKGGSEASQSW